MISGIILAAGLSSRMGSRIKANLIFKGKTFLKRSVELFQLSDIADIVVVTGRHDGEIRKINCDLNVRFEENREYEMGQLRSIQVGLNAINALAEAAIVQMVDMPLVNQNTVKRIVDDFYSSGSQIVVPKFQNRRGHPVLFSRQMFSRLFNTPLDIGARKVLWENPEKIFESEVDDKSILVNINTPEEYERWCEVDG